MTDQVTPEIKAGEDLFKSLAWDALIKAELIALKLDFWPVNSIVMFFTDRLFETLRLQFDLAAIVFRNDAHRATFDKATVALKLIGLSKGTDSEDYKKAKDNAKDALSKFARFGATT